MDTLYLFGFNPDVTIPRGGQRSKDMVQNIFGQKVLRREEFMLFDEDTGRVGQLGSHSIRKFSATFMHRCGCTKGDEVDIRGRWKCKGRTSDVYANVKLPYPDAKVAEKLCLGGPCYYAYDTTVCDDVAMMKQFILSHVVPNVQDEWKNVRGGDGDDVLMNPVKRVPIQINGNQGVVFIDEIPGIPLAGAVGAADGGGNALESIQNQLLALQGSVMSVRRDNHDLQSELGATRLAMERGFTIVSGNIRRIAIVPGHRRVAGPAAVGAVGDNVARAAAGGAGLLRGDLTMMSATLMTTPRSLHDLWVEYQHGVGGRKAARLFTPLERGCCKYKFHRRKIVWDIISNLVRAGHTADAAIDRIYAVYGGQLCLTAIINELKRDKKNNSLNPNLRV